MMGRYMVVVVLCLSLGLAPFMPEPHLIGKIRWVAGGAVGMQLIDWGDLLFHGAPWLALLGMAVFDGVRWLMGRGKDEVEDAEAG